MASRYHWVSAGADLGILGFFPTLQSSPLTLPAGAQMKRFLVKNASFQVTSHGTSQSNQFPWAVTWSVAWTVGPNAGRVIYSTVRDIPMIAAFDTGNVVGVYKVFWHAGDLELGFNQKSTYGKASGVSETLQFTYGFRHDAPTDVTNTNGRFTWQCFVLYYL